MHAKHDADGSDHQVRQMILAHVLCGRERDYGTDVARGLRGRPTLLGSSELADSVQVSGNGT